MPELNRYYIHEIVLAEIGIVKEVVAKDSEQAFLLKPIRTVGIYIDQIQEDLGQLIYIARPNSLPTPFYHERTQNEDDQLSLFDYQVPAQPD